MSKDPAYLFYPADFLIGCSDLTMEERGQYITLLCLQHQKGHLTEKTVGLCLGLQWVSLSDDLRAKFVRDENGCYYNERLEDEIGRRMKHVDKQRENGKKGGRPKANENPKETQTITQTITQNEPKRKPLETVTITENIIEKEKEGTGEKENNSKNSILQNVEFLKSEYENSSWLEAIGQNSSFSPLEIKKHFQTFCTEKDGELYSRTDFKQHFANWLRYHKDKLNQHPNAKMGIGKANITALEGAKRIISEQLKNSQP